MLMGLLAYRCRRLQQALRVNVAVGTEKKTNIDALADNQLACRLFKHGVIAARLELKRALGRDGDVGRVLHARHAVLLDGFVQHGRAERRSLDTCQSDRLVALVLDDKVSRGRQIGGHGAYPAVTYADLRDGLGTGRARRGGGGRWVSVHRARVMLARVGERGYGKAHGSDKRKKGRLMMGG